MADRGDVRDIDALREFHARLTEFADQLAVVVGDIRQALARADDHFTVDRPAYWREQARLADEALVLAEDELSAKRSAPRPADRPAATEAMVRVKRCKQRVRLCGEKLRAARQLSIELGRRCDEFRGLLADVTEQAEVVLPAAAAHLRGLIKHLDRYAE